MPSFELGFTDFDTVCYNEQYNIIQLINKCVGLTIAFNITAGQVDKVQQDVANLDQKVQDAIAEGESTADNLHDLQQEVRKMSSDVADAAANANAAIIAVNAIENLMWALQDQIDSLDDRVTALGG